MEGQLRGDIIVKLADGLLLEVPSGYAAAGTGRMSTSERLSRFLVGSESPRISIHPSIAWVDNESEDEDSLKQYQTGQKLTGLLSKAGLCCSSHNQILRFPEFTDTSRAQQVEDQINSEHLQKLERLFREADLDKGGGLDIKAFRKAMKKIMDNITEEDIDVIFMKIDADCDGSMGWEEYLNYILREYRGKDDMLKSKSPLLFQIPMKTIPVIQGQEIIKVQFFPSQGRAMDRNEKAKKSSGWNLSGRFLTVSRDGILLYWSDAFKLLRTVQLDQSGRRPGQQMWVTDMVCLSNINLLAIACTDQIIEFFDISGNKCDRLFSLIELDSCVTALDYWTDGYKGVFCVGDVKGNILVFTSLDVLANGIFNVRRYITKPGVLARIPVQLLLRGKASLYRNFRVPALHGDWCHQIKFIPQLNLVASCSAADKRALMLTSLPLHIMGKPQSSTIALKKGILCFDYSPEMNVLVTGGLDPLVRIWNPFVTNSPITLMKGHVTAVTHIIVNGKRNTILSISKDKNIRVWDLLDHFCLQSIPGRSISLGNCPIVDAYYSMLNNILICTTFSIGILYGETEFMDTFNSEVTSHDQPLCTALYNRNFKQVVSGCHHGMVRVWDIMTGQKMMQFMTSEGKHTEITAMTFDGPERRLITALKDGMIKFWNFNNGACLLEMPHLDKTEISGILYINLKIYVAGWNKRVTWYQDVKEDEVIEYKHWKSYHSEDILSIAKYNDELFATASCDGDVVIWNIDSGQAVCRFNASQSPLTLTPNRVFTESKEDPSRGNIPKKPSLAVKPSSHAESGKKRWADSRTSVSTRLLTAEDPSISSSGQRGNLAPVPSVIRQSREKQQDQTKEQQAAQPPGGQSSEMESDSPKDQDAAETSNQEKHCPNWQEELKGLPAAVEKVLFLHTREQSPDTAILLTSSAGGYIYAWSVSSKGGMLGKFRAVHGDVNAVVGTMSTDPEDFILLTGDSLGYIKIWDIESYCTAKEVKKLPRAGKTETSRRNENTFRDLIPKYCRVRARKNPSMGTNEVLDGWSTTLVPPDLLNSWRGHLKNVSHIVYVEKLRLIVTSSYDCNVKLWMLSGRHIGTFGQSLWNVGLQYLMPTEVPSDIRRVASTQTLKVLNEGKFPHWEGTRSIMHTLSQQKRQSPTATNFMQEKSGTISDFSLSFQKMVQKEKRLTRYMDEQMEAEWQQWEEKGKQKSEILGCSYKQRVRRHLSEFLPDVKTCVTNKEQARVYHCIQYADLQSVTPPPVPELLVEMQQFQANLRRKSKSGKRLSTAISHKTHPQSKLSSRTKD
ncbi:LOW QUALITY PROTEIN: EF-hand calcium-binding domain-containing protein 8 [Emydura macquarii macquarii]|uniref:LOW QUALITY PROTEIN: EF-hand calcium-binding domain-containing protein 8 n=1 Tax=Emydura macquarii macquarii TaxID=1129001 RepID=UPI00352A5518